MSVQLDTLESVLAVQMAENPVETTKLLTQYVNDYKVAEIIAIKIEGLIDDGVDNRVIDILRKSKAYYNEHRNIFTVEYNNVKFVLYMNAPARERVGRDYEFTISVDNNIMFAHSDLFKSYYRGNGHPNYSVITQALGLDETLVDDVETLVSYLNCDMSHEEL